MSTAVMPYKSTPLTLLYRSGNGSKSVDLDVRPLPDRDRQVRASSSQGIRASSIMLVSQLDLLFTGRSIQYTSETRTYAIQRIMFDKPIHLLDASVRASGKILASRPTSNVLE